MPALKLDKMSLRALLVVSFNVIILLVLLDLDHLLEHLLLEVDHSCELKMVSLELSNQILLFLHIQCHNRKVIDLNNLFKISDYLLPM